ncbi:MAG: STN domain-containing protein [Sphingobium sp.]|nr:STN domain-containing protein [Sphingobium sp.]
MAHAASARIYAFAIPAQDLARALQEYSRVTGMPVAASPDVMRGRRSQPVSGTMSAERALTQLIGGANVTAQNRAGRSSSSRCRSKSAPSPWPTARRARRSRPLLR